MIVLVCGDRNWTNKEVIHARLSQFPPDTVIVHGGNGYDARGKALWGQPDRYAVRGADKLAGQVAEELGFKVVVFTPAWERFGRKAGPIRNSVMLQTCPDLVLAFHNDLEHSKGTKDMVRQVNGSVPTEVITE